MCLIEDRTSRLSDIRDAQHPIIRTALLTKLEVFGIMLVEI